ncbi:DUF3320 domain-containing protein [Cryobacterium sp. 5B3]|uniref:DUF3320 domain-containing protein n=3 Tax=unclassified Cryobacterium TaxID=2649013 RepID=UPI002AB3C072|nr:DUF3320 domain-containing protein [Cryobacterium sp. 5B3]MDY7541184.1 DUF3320 domain-containing protein [Cryobacterium sp. 5B3]MEB0274245.1 DUF3320 domain-containing protein [Cryobacterium sp. 5B3]
MDQIDSETETDGVATAVNAGAPAAAAAASARIGISSVPFLSYAMAHCRVPVVDEIVIENLGGEQRAATLEVEVTSAAGSLGAPRVVIVDLGAGQSTTLRTVELVLDPALMLAVEEQRPGSIRATLRDAAGRLLAETSAAVQILASSQWIATPLHLGLELLAAHVQPNAAAIAPLLVEASDLLQHRTGDSALSGYQSESPERVDAVVEAIYDAMRARDIRYAMPPASWGTTGQKVRTPAEVLEGQLGTCLDTTVTLAAALEQAGLNSTLWLLEGHIFLGYWRVDSALGAVAHTDVADIVNLVDLGSIGLVETTGVTGGSSSMPFAEARRSPHTQYLAAGLEKFLGETDVRTARQSRIWPLPSRSVGPDGAVTVTVYQAGAGPVIAPYYARDGSALSSAAPEAAPVPPRVTQWKNALLDLSLRNKLINYTDRSGYPLFVPGPAVARLEDAINAGTPITLVPADAVPNVDRARGIRFGKDLPEQTRELMLADKKGAFVDITEASYTSKLRYLANKARTIVEETGANNLYLTFGMLHWRFNDRELRSPLVLIPVNMTSASRGSSYRLTIDEAGASTPNYCLLEKLRASFGLEIAGLATPGEDASGIDLAGAFTAVREAIAEAGLPFRVEETVELSILQFAKFRLWKDLDENWEALSQNSLVAHLINTPLDAYADPVAAAGAGGGGAWSLAQPAASPFPASPAGSGAPAGSTARAASASSPGPGGRPVSPVDLDALGGSVPVPADSSQLEAVAEATAGRTFVLEGPPGTGKSQTITNLLARALADGKRVLFVAEKRAALDVVKKRLESVGLGDFSLDLHDKAARPAAVRAQIKAALELRIVPDLPALAANREAAAASRGTLARYADRLHESNAAGLSLYSARTHALAADASVEPLPIPGTLVGGSPAPVFDELRHVLRQLPEVSDLARPSAAHPWGFVDERLGRGAGAGSGTAESAAEAVRAARAVGTVSTGAADATGAESLVAGTSPSTGIAIALRTAAIHATGRSFDDALAAAQAAGFDLDTLNRMPSAALAGEWRDLAAAPRHPVSVVDTLHTPEWRAFIAGLEQHLAALRASRPDWLTRVAPTVLGRDVPGIHAAALAADAAGFFGRTKKRRAVLAQIADLLTGDAASAPEKAVPLKTLSTLTAALAAAHAEAQGLRDAALTLLVPLVDPAWNPFVPADAEDLATGLAWLGWIGDALNRPAPAAAASTSGRFGQLLPVPEAQLSTAATVAPSTATGVPTPAAEPSNSSLSGQVRPLPEAQLSAAATVAAPPAADAHTHTADLRAYYASTPLGEGREPLTALAAAWQSLDTAADVQPADRSRWAGDLGFVARWSATRADSSVDSAQPVALERWLALVRHLEPLRRHGLADARSALLAGSIPAEDAALAFDKGLAIASITEREDATALGDFNLVAHSKTITRFTASTRAVRGELPRAIPAEVLGLRRFDTNLASGQVGGLRRQLDRQRGGMSVRALLENYGDLITQVMPCTLMSPESVARFFPAHAALFDIVVFDEASQIRVADAIGAMGRAASVVVVGDSKQMPPTSFAEASANIDDEGDAGLDGGDGVLGAVADEESILTECVQARVPSKWLSWHYRSQDESLIAFSNHYYYESRLSSFPAPMGPGSAGSARASSAESGTAESGTADSVGSTDAAAASDHGVSLVRVSGQFERSVRGTALRTNPVEARAIVDDIERRFQASPGVSPSVGVITFNAQQRNLIENLLRDNDDERIALALDEVDGLFVKNLENVQGDERDSILFSIAFSANEKGAVPLNFGPLSRAGGERRLNVAITRARRQVVLYASFDPAVLRAQDTSSVGIKHLKAYLEMAGAGAEALSTDVRRTSTVDRHRDDIAAALRAAGHVVQTDVGLSDFRVDLSLASAADPARPLVAVLLDGPNWRARRTVSDRDGLPVDVLQGIMRWPGVERVWLPEWLHHRDETIARLGAAVEAAAATVAEGAAPAAAGLHSAAGSVALAEPTTIAARTSRASASTARAARTATQSVTDPTAQVEPAGAITPAVVATSARGLASTSAATSPLMQDYAEWSPGLLGPVTVLDALPRAAASAQVRSAISAAVETEGPIHSARLIKLVAGAFGLDRVTQARAASIVRCVPADLSLGADEPFYWPVAVNPSDWPGARRTPPGVTRALEHVPLVEIANAMRLAAEAAAGIDDAGLRRETLAFFGGRRLTASIGIRLDASLALALDTGRLTRTPAGLLLPG